MKNNEQKVINSITVNILIDKSYAMDAGFICKYKFRKNVICEFKTDKFEF